MYDEWPLIEFADVSSSVLNLFSKETGCNVSAMVLAEVSSWRDSATPQRVQTEEQLRWCLQVLNHALTLPLHAEREFTAVEAAVRVYAHWLRALTDAPDGAIPTPLVNTPEKYFRNIIEALRAIFLRRAITDVRAPLVVSRQAALIDAILETVRAITNFSSRKYQDEIWARSLTFMLNSADLLFAEAPAPGCAAFSKLIYSDDISVQVGGRMVDALLELWMRAVQLEQIPSPSYWKTLRHLCLRWRHHVPVLESWARKLLSLSVLLSQSMYGANYCAIPITDDSVLAFATGSATSGDSDEDDGPGVLCRSWFDVLALIGSPADILQHDPGSNAPINGGVLAPAIDPTKEAAAKDSLPYSFFLATTAVQRMIDVFYGDSRVSVEFKEREVLQRKAELAIDVPASSAKRFQTSNMEQDRDATLTNEFRGSFSSSVSGKTGSFAASEKEKDKEKDKKKSMKDKNTRTNGAVSMPPPSRAETVGTMTASAATTGKLQQNPSVDAAFHRSLKPSPPPSTSLFVGYALKANPGYVPFVGDRAPKSERILELVMDWLFDAALVRDGKSAGSSDVTDDVISGLSLCSVDLEDVPAAMQTASLHERQSEASASRRNDYFQQRQTSCAGSTASSSGHDAASLHGAGSSEYFAADSADGVSAGKAAAVGALARIVCSKTSSEKLPATQLAQFYAMLHETLIDKDRLVLCALFYYGDALYRLNLPGVEALLPHWLFALDIILIESSKLRLHPSFSDVEMRSRCLKALAAVVSWPAVFGMAKLPQAPGNVQLKSAAPTYLHLRPRIYKTLIFSLRNETNAANLQLTFAMSSVLVVESAAYDLSLNEEQTKEMQRIAAAVNQGQPEKGQSGSFVRGLISAICDRLCRPEWAGDFTVCLAAIDVLHVVATLHPGILFSNKDMSTGSLIISSLCRFIETQLAKPPPMQSKDLHSSVVAAYSCIVSWLTAAPMLSECESVLHTVAEAVQLGVTGARKTDVPAHERKVASKRVLEAAECLLFSLFSIVGRGPRSVGDERRLLYEFGPSAIDTTKFMHFLINGDTLLSVHEASHIQQLSSGMPCVLYVRRSPKQAASIGVAKLKPRSEASKSDDSQKPSVSSVSSTQSTASAARVPAPPPPSLAEQFEIPPEFHKIGCKLDASVSALQSTPEIEAIVASLNDPQPLSRRREERNVWSALSEAQRKAEPPICSPICDSARIFLYDLGLIDKNVYGSEFVYLDSGQNADFYRELHDFVDSCPSRNLLTAHIFYVRDGQRNAVDILENALNLQVTSPEFCGLLAELGEGVEVGKYEGWTGHWSTAFSTERKPMEERDAVDHYIIDGVTHAIVWADENAELAFVTPSERSVRMFKQDLPPPQSARRHSVKSYSGNTSSEDMSRGGSDMHLTAQSGRTKSSVSTVSSEGGATAASSQFLASTTSQGASSAQIPRRLGDLTVLVVWLERLEDLHNFPAEDLLPACDDGGDKAGCAAAASPQRPAFLLLFLFALEPGLVHVSVRGPAARFGDAGPLVDGVVVSLSCLPQLLRLTLLNVTKRSVAEVENYQLMHIKRRQAIADFGKRFASSIPYEDFVATLLQR